MTTKTTAPLTCPALLEEAEGLLTAHISMATASALEELGEHYPAVRAFLASPTGNRPEGVPEDIYLAVYEATNEYGELCWPILRGSLMSRAYSLCGCPVGRDIHGRHSADASLELRKALIEAGTVRTYYDDGEDEDECADLAHISGSVLARALGVSLYQRLDSHFRQIEDGCKWAFQEAADA